MVSCGSPVDPSPGSQTRPPAHLRPTIGTVLFVCESRQSGMLRPACELSTPQRSHQGAALEQTNSSLFHSATVFYPSHSLALPLFHPSTFLHPPTFIHSYLLSSCPRPGNDTGGIWAVELDPGGTKKTPRDRRRLVSCASFWSGSIVPSPHRSLVYY